MAYTLIIVDDEEHIREGLSDLVDWASLGFRVVAKLEDGDQALDWLHKTGVDIILSDINMTHMSGLELAKYVHANHPQTKIVLISGYKEFDFVKQAMSYNVVNYLLKPTKLADIVTVFQDVKNRLDKEREEQEQLSKVMRRNSELLPAIRKQLFRDMATGKLNDSIEAEKLLRLTEVDANTSDNRCALVRLCLELADASSAGEDEHTAAESVENMIHNEISQILYVPVIFNGGHLDIAALDLVTNRDAASFKSAILSHMQTAVLRINALLSMDATVEVAGMFTNLQQLMEDAMTLPAMHPDFAEPEPTDGSIQENVRLAEERKQFLGFVGAGNIEALPGQYENILNEAIQGSLPIQLTKNMLIELFSSLCCKLNEMNLPIDKITSRTFSYETILRLNSNRDLLRWGLSLLKDISSYVRSHADAEPTIIQIAKEYVVNHFDKEISLETAASHVYLSSDYFGKLFKQHTGSSFTDFVVEVRINKALEYLQDPQFKIYEIGSIVGYKNTKYFFKLFKKQTGYTPTEYRRHSINKDKR